MTSPVIRRRLKDTLWPDDLAPGEKVFAILDGARDTRIFGAVDASRQDKLCLYSVYSRGWPGDGLPWDLIGVAPYLVQMDRDDDFTNLILRDGWSNCWGIFLRADSNIEKLWRHFREFLVVRNEAGRQLMFRYY